MKYERKFRSLFFSIVFFLPFLFWFLTFSVYSNNYNFLCVFTEKYIWKGVNRVTDTLLEINYICVIIDWKWTILLYKYKWKNVLYSILEFIMESIHNKGNLTKHSFFTNFCNFYNKSFNSSNIWEIFAKVEKKNNI